MSDTAARFDRVFVVNPPSPPGYVSNKDSMGGFGQLFPVGATLFPPLDLVYLASYLAEKGTPVEILECLALELDAGRLAAKIAAGGASLVFVRTSAPTLDWDLSLCRQIKAAAPECRIGIYGAVVPHVGWRIREEDAIDYILEGEPDEAVFELASGLPEDAIRGLAFRRSGGWVENARRPAAADLDRLPFPKWEMLPYRKYTLPKSSLRHDVPFLPMLTSRGCPIGCHYCPYPIGQGVQWRFRSPGNVVDEVEHLVRDLGIRYVIFRDPMFSMRQGRVIEICDEIRRRDLRLEWRCETRIDFLKEETLRAMAAAGCTGVNFGVESADVEIQAGVGRKPITKEEFHAAVTLCRRLGIKTFAFFIIGLPHDTVETILQTIAFAVALPVDWVQFTAASPFIGTKLRDWAVAQGLITDSAYAYVNSHEVVVGNENLSAEQLKPLYSFARFLQNTLINRKGILKDDARTGKLYRTARSLADRVSGGLARAVFAAGRRHFVRRLAGSPGPRTAGSAAL